MAPTAKSGRKSFMEYALDRFEKNYGQFYKSYDAFLEHFQSGEVKTPFPDMVKIVSDWLAEDATHTERNLHSDNIRKIEGMYYAFIEMRDITNISLICGTDEVYFEVDNGRKRTPSLSRSHLESLPDTELAETIINAIESLVRVEDIPLSARHKFGDMVRFLIPMQSNFETVDVTAYIKGVHFFPGKVKYDLEVSGLYGKTKLYNVDSALVRKWNEELDTDNSIVDFLKSRDRDCSFKSRKTYWDALFPDTAKYWQYRGTEQQNILLLNKLKDIV